jgi:hypothetical protein
MKDPLLQDEDPGLPPVIHIPRPSSRPLAAEPHLAQAEPPRGSQLRSHFVFGPGFTQVLLLVCILMLGIVIGMKVSDYFHERQLEKSELALYRAGQSSRIAEPAPTPPAVPQVVMPSQPLPPPPVPQTEPLPVPTVPSATPAPAAPTTPDLSNELALLQQERDLMRQRFDTLNGSSAGTPAAPRSTTASEPPPQSTSGLPAPRASKPSSSSVSGSPSTANRAPKEEISAAEQRIRDAPALGKVLEYDADWHFVVINCGTNHNLEAGRKLAIRRGGNILGLINIDEILPEQSVAELDGAWKTDPEAIKPQPGDDVLTFPPF